MDEFRAVECNGVESASEAERGLEYRLPGYVAQLVCVMSDVLLHWGDSVSINDYVR